jgi:hypothetical protein
VENIVDSILARHPQMQLQYNYAQYIQQLGQANSLQNESFQVEFQPQNQTSSFSYNNLQSQNRGTPIFPMANPHHFRAYDAIHGANGDTYYDYSEGNNAEGEDYEDDDDYDEQEMVYYRSEHIGGKICFKLNGFRSD